MNCWENAYAVRPFTSGSAEELAGVGTGKGNLFPPFLRAKSREKKASKQPKVMSPSSGSAR
jgi:hypothetical protein